MASSVFVTTFSTIEASEGVVDIAIRYDTESGKYEYGIEENGLPSELPTHVFLGILEAVKYDAMARRGAAE